MNRKSSDMQVVGNEEWFIFEGNKGSKQYQNNSR